MLKNKLLKSDREFKNLIKLKDQFSNIIPNIILNYKINQKKIYDYHSKKQFFKSIFTPAFIMNDINTNFNKLTNFSCKYKTNTLNFFYFEDKIKIDLFDLQFKIIKSFSVLEFFNSKNKIVNIYLALTKYKKKINSSKLEIDSNTVNSGFTAFYLGLDPTISIFRKEESDRVIIHELVHYLKKDFHNFKSINKYILNDINVNNNEKYINFFESYTDSLAIIFNSIFNSILTFNNVNDVFYTELKYIEDTAFKILNHFKFKNIKELFQKSNNKIYQKTSVLSYYILKLGILSNIDEFLSINKINSEKIDEKKAFELYKFSKKNLLKLKKKNNYLNKNNTLKMSYNSIIFNLI